MVAQQLHERLERGPAHRLRHVRTGHVVQDHDRRQCGEEIPMGRKVRCLEIHHHVPPQGLHAPRDLQQVRGRA